MRLLAFLRIALLVLGAWYLTRGVQRRVGAMAESRGMVDPTLTRVLRYCLLSFVLFGVFFFLWILSSVKAWVLWIQWASGIAMGITLLMTFTLAGVAGWRLHGEEEKATRSDK